jgi:hypothetical protein
MEIHDGGADQRVVVDLDLGRVDADAYITLQTQIFRQDRHARSNA